MKRNPNAVQNNTLIIPRRHSGPFFPHHPCAGTNSWWDLPQLRLVFVSPGMGKPHNPERFSKGFTPPGLGIKGVTVLSTRNVFAHWQIGFPWENIIHFTGKIKKKTQPKQTFSELFCMRSSAAQLGAFSHLWRVCVLLQGTVQHPALLLGDVQSLILPGQKLCSSCAELFRAVPPSLAFCTAQGWFHCLPSSSVELQFHLRISLLCNSNPREESSPKLSQIRQCNQGSDSKWRVYFVPCDLQQLPPAFSSAHRSHS